MRWLLEKRLLVLASAAVVFIVGDDVHASPPPEVGRRTWASFLIPVEQLPSRPYTSCAGSHNTVGGHPGDDTSPIPAIRQVPGSSTRAMSVRPMALAPSGRYRSPCASTSRSSSTQRRTTSYAGASKRVVTPAPTWSGATTQARCMIWRAASKKSPTYGCVGAATASPSTTGSTSSPAALAFPRAPWAITRRKSSVISRHVAGMSPANRSRCQFTAKAWGLIIGVSVSSAMSRA